MAHGAINFALLDLRGAFDLAIAIEEEAELRYRHLCTIVDGAAADVFRSMVTNEAKHRRELVSRRDVLFRHAPPRFDTSLVGDVEAVDPDAVGRDITARQALELALAAEVRAHDFYAGAIPYVNDREVRSFFEALREEEIEHQDLLRKKLAELPPGR